MVHITHLLLDMTVTCCEKYCNKVLDIFNCFVKSFIKHLLIELNESFPEIRQTPKRKSWVFGSYLVRGQWQGNLSTPLYTPFTMEVPDEHN